MRILFSFALLLAGVATAAAQGKPAPTPKLSDKAVAEIRTLQLRQAQLTIQAQQLLAQYQTQKEQLDAEIKAAEEKALKDAKLDPAKFEVDDGTLEVKSRAGPPGASIPRKREPN